MKLLRLFAILLLALRTPAVLASQEGQFSCGSFSVASPGIGTSGPVVVAGDAERGAVFSLRVEAFGKRFVLGAELLAKLAGASPNGIQLSYEGGYPGLGGRTLYIVFSRGFVSSRVATVQVSVEEEGEIKVIEGQQK